MINRRTAAILALTAPLVAEKAIAQTVNGRYDDIALVAYPRMAALDFVAPQYMFSYLSRANIHLVAKTRDPIATDTSGLSVVPTRTFEECPKDLTVLFVPGGTSGTIAAMQDEETLAFLADRGARASYVTSVCTGSLVLGAAGLLKGYRATSHWVALDVLERFGATSVRKRVVRDRNRLTGGGVTAGLDFGLAIIALMRGRPEAEFVQLFMEYNPQPPFDGGSPMTAPSSTVATIREDLAPFVARASSVASRS